MFTNSVKTVKKGGNPQNLTPFKPGQSGNLKGRPKKLPELDKLLADVLGGDTEDTPAKRILEALIKKAEKGDTRAAEILLDRGYGKAKQSIFIEANPIKALTIEPASRGAADSGK